MYYIKIVLWIFILSVFYATGTFDFFSTAPSFLLIFALIFSVVAKKLADKITVALICGAFISAFGNVDFVITLLVVFYATLIIGNVFNDDMSKYAYFVVFFVFFVSMCLETLIGFSIEGITVEVFLEALFCSVVNFAYAVILYPLIKKTFCKKERYIFEEL